MLNDVVSNEEERVSRDIISICADRHDAVREAHLFNMDAVVSLERSQLKAAILGDNLVALQRGSEEFLQGCGEWRTRRQLAVQAVGLSAKVQDLLDLPHTLENCIRAEAFHEASLILDFITSLCTDHPNLEVVQSTGDACEAVLSQLVGSVSLPRFSQTLSLPATMKLVGFLRRVGFLEEEIRIIFLDSKARALDSDMQDSAALAHSPYSRICKLIGEFKVRVTDTMTQYSACFGSHSTTQLSSWVHGRSVVFLPIVEMSLSAISSGSELTSLVDQAVHLSAILSPVGVDVGESLRLVTELRAVRLFQSHAHAALLSYQTALDTFSTATSSRPGSQGPLQELLCYIPLAYLLNGILLGCNEIRKCAFDGIAIQCIQTLEAILRQVVRDCISAGAEVGYRKALFTVLIPHTITTLQTLFPVFASNSRVFDGLVSLSIES